MGVRLGVELADVFNVGRMLNSARAQRLNIADGIAEWHTALDQELSCDQTGTARAALAMDGNGFSFGQQLLESWLVQFPCGFKCFARRLIVFYW